MEQEIINAYIPGVTSLREIARNFGTDHHRVKRILQKNGITVEKSKTPPREFTDEHKRKIGESSKKRKGDKHWAYGKKMSDSHVLKNMCAHLRFDVELDWLSQFNDIEKLKCLNECITNRDGRFDEDTEWYKQYIIKFYDDPKFNSIFVQWCENGKDKYMKPSIDHIIPRADGGGNNIDNLQFLTWFENRCKNDMSVEDWNKIKSNIGKYLL